jgi:transposase
MVIGKRCRTSALRDFGREKGHAYHIVGRDSERSLPIWSGGKDRSEEILEKFYEWLGPKKCKQIQPALLDMWKAFENSARKMIPEAVILLEKLQVDESSR